MRGLMQAILRCMTLVGLAAAQANLQMDERISTMVLSTPRPVSDAQMVEYKQDFVDVDFNKDEVMDGQEVRAHFKGTITHAELFQFFLDSDKDKSGTISLQEYVDYAAALS
eukprot:TRINITY_DN33412_c0_g1_i1.p2 TRINITY_DN33412_c0_g1~~TRINITY_DN33412_c0_g1_i1.p2  ORF type:complete len:111 (-),score=29.49 TRINITY_DN33412_c0_g1_i1:213-545(-)